MQTIGFYLLEEVLHRFDLVLLDSSAIDTTRNKGERPVADFTAEEVNIITRRFDYIKGLVVYYNNGEEPHILTTQGVKNELRRLEAKFNIAASSDGRVRDIRGTNHKRIRFTVDSAKRLVASIAGLTESLPLYQGRTEIPIQRTTGTSDTDASLVSALLHYATTPREGGLYGTATIITGDSDVTATFQRTMNGLDCAQQKELAERANIHWYSSSRRDLERIVFVPIKARYG